MHTDPDLEVRREAVRAAAAYDACAEIHSALVEILETTDDLLFPDVLTSIAACYRHMEVAPFARAVSALMSLEGPRTMALLEKPEVAGFSHFLAGLAPDRPEVMPLVSSWYDLAASSGGRAAGCAKEILDKLAFAPAVPEVLGLLLDVLAADSVLWESENLTRMLLGRLRQRLDPGGDQKLLEGLRDRSLLDPSPARRGAALGLLAYRAGDERVRDVLVQALGDPLDANVVVAVKGLVRHVIHDDIRGKLASMVLDPNPCSVRAAALEVLAPAAHAPEVLAAIEAALGDSNPALRSAAIRAIQAYAR